MDTDTLLFFDAQPAALPLYEALENRILAEIQPVQIKAQKSQISFYNRHLFGCVSFLRVKKKKELPDPYLVVTFGLDHPVESPRITVVTEPYPNRWTHHLILSRPEKVNDELMAWLKEAADFSARK